MKLIIDIPEEVVTKIQNGEDYRYDLHTTIAQGIPYEPKDDLISREALIKAIFEHCRSETEGLNHFWYDENIISLIDNAPTVPLPDFKEGYKQAIIDGKTNYSRPQGEWIFRKGVTCGGYYKCNKCGEVERAEKNYCPNCGALMKGGAE